MGRRKIAIVTGTRAEYGLLRSIIEHIRDHDELTPSLVVTGMHLSPQYGKTFQNILEDGFEIDYKVDMLFDSDTGLGMAKSLAAGVSGMAEAFRHLDPDIVLVLGDRGEPFAAAVTAAHMMIPVAHIHGGDATTGATIDDSLRYSLTKFAHIHFPASEESADRIEKLGEEPWRITISGAPGLDDILSGRYIDPQRVCEDIGLERSRDIVLVIQHPVTTQPDKAGHQMRKTLDAVMETDAQVVVIYPNSDAGGRKMIDTIENHPRREDFFRFKSLPREKYLGLMDAADVMVGNSSSGIIEAPSMDLPFVEIGSREERRQRADNILSVPHDAKEIEAAVKRALRDNVVKERARNCKNPYDYGGAGERIAKVLAGVETGQNLLRKTITY